jgi:hypothetical protein
MRVLLAAVLAFVVHVASAAADPAPPAAPAAPRSFVGIGVTLGDDLLPEAGLTVEVGVRVTGPLSLHAQASHGDAGSVLEPSALTGTFDQVRGGLEGRWCAGRVCAIAGIDAGYQTWSLRQACATWNDGCVPGDPVPTSPSIEAIGRLGIEWGHGARWRATGGAIAGSEGSGWSLSFTGGFGL